MKCTSCNREAKDRYCELHRKAYRRITQKYVEWRKALDISWEEYLNELAKNPYTGSWAKEVVEELLKKRG